MKYRSILPLVWSFAASTTFAASTIQLKPTADAFLSSVTPSTNYGAQGTLAVAGANSGKGTFESLLKFDLTAAVSQFDTEFGTGNWSVSTITLTFASNVGSQGGVSSNAMFPVINGGLFSILWMQDDSWTETGITYNNLGDYTSVTSSLGSWSYAPPGNNVAVTRDLGANAFLFGDVTTGGSVSFLVAPGDDTVAYLFNSRTYNMAANHPVLSVTAIPEAASCVLLVPALVGFLAFRRRTMP